MASDLPNRSALDRHSNAAFNVLQYDLLADMASALAYQESLVEKAMAALRDFDERGGPADERAPLLRKAAQAVWAFFVQRELCGFRNHDEVIKHYRIPGAVLVRLGAMDGDQR